jgi:formylglycine-generating enzyme required for sulfatase activity
MLRVVLAWVVLVAGGCSKACVPGATQKCACPGGVEGAQTCGDDGQRWLACGCGAAQGSGSSAAAEPVSEDMVRLEAGSFEMGSEAGDADEKPVHTVKLERPFLLDKTEVTVAAYAKCVAAEKCAPPDKLTEYCNWGKDDLGNHPVNCVGWAQADQYCRWANKALPSEAQWEYAARSGGLAGHPYPWGDATADCSRAVMFGKGGRGCGKDPTWPVCSKVSGNSVQGACDLAGNVWEWVADDYGPYTSGTQDGAIVMNGKGEKVVRGGSWYKDASYLRAASRDHDDPSLRDGNVGFRCARTL